jgi:hypothetical protein
MSDPGLEPRLTRDHFYTTKTGKDEGELANVCLDFEQSMKP